MAIEYGRNATPVAVAFHDAAPFPAYEAFCAAQRLPDRLFTQLAAHIAVALRRVGDGPTTGEHDLEPDVGPGIGPGVSLGCGGVGGEGAGQELSRRVGLVSA